MLHWTTMAGASAFNRSIQCKARLLTSARLYPSLSCSSLGNATQCGISPFVDKCPLLIIGVLGFLGVRRARRYDVHGLYPREMHTTQVSV